MGYCVIDTERIKGNLIYLLSYQLYDDSFNLCESKTFQDISINVDNRKAPKRKVRELDDISIKVNSFIELYETIRPLIENNVLIVFSDTDIGAFKKDCRIYGIPYNKLTYIDLQEALYELSTDAKHKSNLKDYCIKNGIKHNAHIPEDDCRVTFILYIDLLNKYGEEFLNKFKYQGDYIEK